MGIDNDIVCIVCSHVVSIISIGTDICIPSILLLSIGITIYVFTALSFFWYTACISSTHPLNKVVSSNNTVNTI